ncbi:putative beta-glucosidase I [Trichophaea hybrida]|nr:putative beta-glucosidase I [Trichophaea hybrida]
MADVDIEAVLKKLSLQEKAELLAGSDFSHTSSIPSRSLPRLHISDGPNTARGCAFFNSTPNTCLPCSPALGATFDPSLVQRIGALIAAEAHAKGIHVVLGPVLNIPRSPLGGRNHEAFAEDPLLVGLLGGAFVRGAQEGEEGVRGSGVVACAKHLVGTDQEQGPPFSMDVRVSERALREIYLRSFQLTVRYGNPGALMASYGKINGVHVTEDLKFFGDAGIVRGEWGWRGCVMTDWYGLYSTTEPITAGVDLEMPGPPAQWRGKRLAHAVIAGKVTEGVVDERVRNVLGLIKMAARSGIPENATERELNRKEDRALLREAAAEGIVLLKNNRGVLPLNKNKPVALIGPNTKFAPYRGGRIAHLRPYETVSTWEGVRAQCSSEMHFAQGVYNHKEMPLLGAQLTNARGGRGFDLRVYLEPANVEGERRCIDHFEFLNSCGFFFNYSNPDLKGDLWYVDIEGDFTPEESGLWDLGVSVQGTANLYVDGKLLIDNTTKQTLGEGFFQSGTREEVGSLCVEKGRTYKILCHWGSPATSKINVPSMLMFIPGGIRLSACPRLDPEQAIAEAVALAKSTEQVVLCAGLMGDWEQEGSDRQNMFLPPGTDRLITAVLEANPKAVIALNSASPVVMPWVDHADTLLLAWYGGNQYGHALADVLYGDVNPSGKMPITFPCRLEDNPSFLCHRAERRKVRYAEDVYVGYRWYDTLDIEVQFPFGYGLSYTSFELSALEVDAEDAEEEGRLKVGVTVKNVGESWGKETVQVYVSQRGPSVGRPAKELRGFEKLGLMPGAEQRVVVEMEMKYVAGYWDEEKDMWCCEKDRYEVLVGTSSRGAFLKGAFEIEDTWWWRGL